MSRPDVIAISATTRNLSPAYGYEEDLLDMGYCVKWTVDPARLEELIDDSDSGDLDTQLLFDLMSDPLVSKNRLETIETADVVLGVNEVFWGRQRFHIPSMTEHDLILAAARGTLPILSQRHPQLPHRDGLADLYRAVSMEALGVRCMEGDVQQIDLFIDDYRRSPHLPDAQEYVQLLRLEQGEQ